MAHIVRAPESRGIGCTITAYRPNGAVWRTVVVGWRDVQGTVGAMRADCREGNGWTPRFTVTDYNGRPIIGPAADGGW